MGTITLKAARVNKGMTQDEAAKAIGISPETLSNYERGNSFPDVPIILKIEMVYGVQFSDIIFLPNNHDLIVKNKMVNNKVGWE